MSDLVERLMDDGWNRREVQRLRDLAFDQEGDARRNRVKADRLELELVEMRAAANILQRVGLRVDRDEDGAPRVHIDPTADGGLRAALWKIGDAYGRIPAGEPTQEQIDATLPALYDAIGEALTLVGHPFEPGTPE
jgi:hypothetical protein